MSQPRILIVDDSALQRRLHAALVSRRLHYAYVEAADGAEALDILRADKENSIFAVLLDLSMAGMDGREALRHMQKMRPELPVIVVTSTQDIDEVVEVVRLGAFDYLIKPANPELLQNALHKAAQLHELQREVARLRRESMQASGFDTCIGDDPATRSCVKLGRQAAASDITVLITGESGVGKEVLARAIHDESARRDKPFIAVNCGAIPHDLVESALFGHMRGSFTGAVADALGKFREADGGTLFLDEVGELPMAAQVKLLRALQQREVEPVGAARSVPVNIRIAAATNRDPLQAMRQGFLREDLFYRLNVFPIHIPPLRQRPRDILKLADHFLRRYGAIEQKPVIGYDDATRQWLLDHSWPGNVRELENRIYRAVLLCENSTLTLDTFLTPYEQPAGMADPIIFDKEAPQIALVNAGGDFKPMEQIKNETERAALQFCAGNVTQAARLLKVGKSTLYRHRHEGAPA